uniref:Uncharacterized protein n=1 Tax=Octopus bimaculoides TaxID=37653 RepID=A0A0L8FQJ0_OCTBM
MLFHQLQNCLCVLVKCIKSKLRLLVMEGLYGLDPCFFQDIMPINQSFVFTGGFEPSFTM